MSRVVGAATLPHSAQTSPHPRYDSNGLLSITFLMLSDHRSHVKILFFDFDKLSTVVIVIARIELKIVEPMMTLGVVKAFMLQPIDETQTFGFN